MSYPNATNLTQASITSGIGLLQTVNDLSGGLFGPILSLMFWGLLFVMSMAASRKRGLPLMASSFATFILNLFLANQDLISGYFAAVPLLFFAIGLFIPNE